MAKNKGGVVDLAAMREAAAARDEPHDHLDAVPEKEVDPEQDEQIAQGKGSGAPGVMQFSVDQLFAAYGASKFENDILRAQLTKAEQQVVTLSNIIRGLEGRKAK
jgi:hypothetical protein